MTDTTDRETARRLLETLAEGCDDFLGACSDCTDMRVAAIAAALAAARAEGIASTFEQRAADLNDLERCVRDEERELAARVAEQWTVEKGDAGEGRGERFVRRAVATLVAAAIRAGGTS